MKSFLLTFVLLILTASNVPTLLVEAYSTDHCPQIDVYCGENSCCGEKRTFNVMLQCGDDCKPTLKWSVSAGKIIEGLGDGQIVVDAKGVKDPIEVTVEVGNITVPVGCPTTAKYKTDCQKNCPAVEE